MRVKYVIEGDLICGSEVAISENSPVRGLLDKMVVRIRQLKLSEKDYYIGPYVSGSSLKGVLRATCEQLLRSMAVSAGLVGERLHKYSLTIYEKLFEAYKRTVLERDALYSRLLQDVNVYRRFETVRELLEKRLTERWNIFCCNVLDTEAEQTLKKIASVQIAGIHIPILYIPCLACQLFGGPGIASHVTVYDAYVADPHEVFTRTRTSVAIDRVFRRQKPGRLYMIEYVEPMSRFRFRMDVLNLDLEKVRKFESRIDEYAKFLNLDYIQRLDKERLEEFVEFLKQLKAYTVFQLLRMLIKGELSVGGRKSVGFGKVRLDRVKIKKFEVSGLKVVEQDVTESLKLYLL